MYTTSNTTVCVKLAKFNLLLYTGGIMSGYNPY